MSKHILVVFGATGNQGGGLIHYLVNDKELSEKYSIRAVTRDPSSSSSQKLLKAGVEVVKGDLDDTASIKNAVKNAHTVFLATYSIFDDEVKTREFRQGKTVADAAVEAGVQYFIFSTLDNTKEFTGGKITHLDQFDSKYQVEQYVRSLPIKSAFFAPGSFMQNFLANQAPQPLGDGTYGLFNFVSPETQLPLIETAGDTGKYIGAYLAEPEKYQGKVFYAATYLKTYDEIVEIMSKVSGKTIKYVQIPREKWESFVPNKLMATYLADMFLYIQDYGYYGPQSKERVEWTAKNARGKLTTLEEFLEKNPLNLK